MKMFLLQPIWKEDTLPCPFKSVFFSLITGLTTTATITTTSVAATFAAQALHNL